MFQHDSVSNITAIKMNMCFLVYLSIYDISLFSASSQSIISTTSSCAAKEKVDKKKAIADDLKAKKDKEEKDKKDAKIKAKKEVKDNALVLLEEGKTGETVADLEAKEKKQMNEIESADDGVNRSLYTLQDVSFSVKKGQLIAVVGAVGSGKSSLLSGLLGEMNLQSGSVRMAGSVAYCDQRPWILNTTVKVSLNSILSPYHVMLFISVPTYSSFLIHMIYMSPISTEKKTHTSIETNLMSSNMIDRTIFCSVWSMMRRDSIAPSMLRVSRTISKSCQEASWQR